MTVPHQRDQMQTGTPGLEEEHGLLQLRARIGEIDGGINLEALTNVRRETLKCETGRVQNGFPDTAVSGGIREIRLIFVKIYSSNNL